MRNLSHWNGLWLVGQDGGGRGHSEYGHQLVPAVVSRQWWRGTPSDKLLQNDEPSPPPERILWPGGQEVGRRRTLDTGKTL